MLITGGKTPTRYKSKCGDDDVSSRNFEEVVPCRPPLTSISDLLQDDVLVEVDAIEPAIEFLKPSLCLHGNENSRNVQQEPTGTGSNQDFGMTPFRDVFQEF